MKRIFSILLILVFVCPPQQIQAEELKGSSVLVSIESHDKTILRKETAAFTFKEALQKLADENDLELTFTQSGSDIKIYSVSHIKNACFGGNDGWFGYVRRKNELLRPDDYLSLALEQGDILTLYYGNPEETKILSRFQMHEQDGAAVFSVRAEQTEWLSRNGIWIKNMVDVKVPDIRIHLFMPGGTQKIASTDKEGSASVSLPLLGVYKYYGEGYAFHRCPTVVKTLDYYFLYGVKNETRITRGEAAAFIVNTFSVKPGSLENNLTDVYPSTDHYTEISRALSAGIVSGYEDGAFHPNEAVTLLEFCLMLSGLYPQQSDPAQIPGVPSWAQERMNRLLAAGVLKGVSLNWNGSVGKLQLMQIYQNTR